MVRAPPSDVWVDQAIGRTEQAGLEAGRFADPAVRRRQLPKPGSPGWSKEWLPISSPLARISRINASRAVDVAALLEEGRARVEPV